MFSGLVPIPTATCAAQQPACSGRRCAPPVDLAKHNEIALEIARQGIVLLENDGVLPLPTGKKMKIAVIGGHAQEGIIAGTGSGAVNPVGGYDGVVKIGGAGNMFLYAPSPLAELKKALPDAQFDFDPGYTPTEAALTARRADMVIAFGIRVEGEGFDNADLSLPWGQDASALTATSFDSPGLTDAASRNNGHGDCSESVGLCPREGRHAAGAHPPASVRRVLPPYR